jgi:hypothetical protein
VSSRPASTAVLEQFKERFEIEKAALDAAAKGDNHA